MKSIFFIWFAFCFFVSQQSWALTGESDISDYRSWTRQLLRDYQFKIRRHHGEGQRLSLKLHLENFLDEVPYVEELQSGETRFVEFFDRVTLKTSSKAKWGNHEVKLTCIWANGRGYGKECKKTQYFQTVYFVLNSNDCTGPITEEGSNRWDSYIKLDHYIFSSKNLKLGSFEKGTFVFKGKIYSLKSH